MQQKLLVALFATVILTCDAYLPHLSALSTRMLSDQKSAQPHVNRRNLLRIAGAALVSSPSIANADYGELSGMSKVQGPIQDIVQPGHWLGQFIGINSHSETWEFPQSPEKVSSALVAVLEDLSPGERKRLLIPNFEIKQKDATKVHVLTWTKSEWLDALDVSFQATASGGTKASVSFYATGFLPTSIPGAPLINTALFFFPFASPGGRGGLLQNFRLNELQAKVVQRLKSA